MACTRWASSAGACTSTFFGQAAPEIGEIAEHEQRAKVGRKSTENSALFESTFSDNSYGAGGGGCSWLPQCGTRAGYETSCTGAHSMRYYNHAITRP